MNDNGLAYSTLLMLLEDWADEYDVELRNPEQFARQVADYVFEELLYIPADEIDNEG